MHLIYLSAIFSIPYDNNNDGPGNHDNDNGVGNNHNNNGVSDTWNNSPGYYGFAANEDDNTDAGGWPTSQQSAEQTIPAKGKGESSFSGNDGTMYMKGPINTFTDSSGRTTATPAHK